MLLAAGQLAGCAHVARMGSGLLDLGGLGPQQRIEANRQRYLLVPAQMMQRVQQRMPVRTGPGHNHGVNHMLEPGDEVLVTATTLDGWYLLDKEGERLGFGYARHMQPLTSPTPQKQTSPASNVRRPVPWTKVRRPDAMPEKPRGRWHNGLYYSSPTPDFIRSKRPAAAPKTPPQPNQPKRTKPTDRPRPAPVRSAVATSPEIDLNSKVQCRNVRVRQREHGELSETQVETCQAPDGSWGR